MLFLLFTLYQASAVRSAPPEIVREVSMVGHGGRFGRMAYSRSMALPDAVSMLTARLSRHDGIAALLREWTETGRDEGARGSKEVSRNQNSKINGFFRGLSSTPCQLQGLSWLKVRLFSNFLV